MLGFGRLMMGIDRKPGSTGFSIEAKGANCNDDSDWCDRRSAGVMDK